LSPDAVLVVALWVLIAVWPVAYVAYPLVLLTIARWRAPRRLEANLPWPTVAILVAAHNEEETIERCVRSCLAQDYPGGPPTVVVGLDGCTDGTEAVLRGIADPRLRIIAYERQGKAATDNSLIAGCHAEVVTTTSAGAEYSPGAIEALANSFRWSRVGCAGGVFAPRRTGSGSAAAEASYFSLEYRLMRAESNLGILAKASGTALAFRRSLWQPISATSDADISLPCLIAGQGALVVLVPDAVVVDDGPRDLRTVFRARRRMATQALANVPRHVVDLARAGYWGQAASLTLHKLLRWLAPWAALAGAIDALVIGVLGHWEYALLLFAVAVGGLLALSAVSLARGRGLSVVAGFLVSQLAFIAAGLDYVRGSGVKRWER
jgi:cellulose synthase/poly-beta-1,6-N-acetylglucosamine synthase-like glycosyltransferase